MYKEYRDTTLCGAVSQMFQEMSGRHSARSDTIRIIKTTVVLDKDVRRAGTVQWTRRNLRFPKIGASARPALASQGSTFKANRPVLV